MAADPPVNLLPVKTDRLLPESLEGYLLFRDYGIDGRERESEIVPQLPRRKESLFHFEFNFHGSLATLHLAGSLRFCAENHSPGRIMLFRRSSPQAPATALPSASGALSAVSRPATGCSRLWAAEAFLEV